MQWPLMGQPAGTYSDCIWAHSCRRPICMNGCYWPQPPESCRSAAHNIPAIQTTISRHRFWPFVHRVNGGRLTDNMQQKRTFGIRPKCGRLRITSVETCRMFSNDGAAVLCDVDRLLKKVFRMRQQRAPDNPLPLIVVTSDWRLQSNRHGLRCH